LILVLGATVATLVAVGGLSYADCPADQKPGPDPYAFTVGPLTVWVQGATNVPPENEYGVNVSAAGHRAGMEGHGDFNTSTGYLEVWIDNVEAGGDNLTPCFGT
jgi:hypothetical protein